MIDSFFWQIFASIFAALTSVVGGLVFERLQRRFRQQQEKYRSDAELIAMSARAVEDSRSEDSAIPGRGVGPEGKGHQKHPAATEAVEHLISNYHEQALGQAQAQFWFSIAAAAVGFVWILYAGSGISEAPSSIGRILPGVVMDAVAFLFFRQASETRQRATELYDRLRQDKQVREAAALVSAIEDARLRSAVRAQISLQMSGLQPNPIDLSSFLSQPAPPTVIKPVAENPAG